MAALSRMACGMHKKVTIKPNDTIVLSSNPIPGNEKAVSGIINELSMKGANVIFQDVHVSGHACQEEIKLIYSLVKPKYAVPVHGEYRHLLAQARVAEELGINKDNIFILTSGDVLELDDEKAEVTLITRPRRFGKTLGMSMLESFFDIRKDSKELFDGLEIAEHQVLCDEWMNQ